MNASLQAIPLANLALAFVPLIAVGYILYRWSLPTISSLTATLRMVVQLILIGYLLVYIFDADHPGIIALVVAVMLAASSWISLRPLKRKDRDLYLKALAAIAVGGGVTLWVAVIPVLELDPWYLPRYFVPLAGMTFANAMNTVSLAAERFEAETANNAAYEDARRTALWASLIPVINSLLAVGLVSLPGTMTGQILSGVSPLLAVRYQILVMCMIFGASGIAAAVYLALVRPREAGETESEAAAGS